MRILRIKQAECALADGRLDEACQILAASDLRTCRDGQRLIGRLVQAMVARGEQHLLAGHTPAAAADCQKAEALGGNLADVADLREQISRAVVLKQQGDRHRAELVAAAREHIEQGRLSLGEKMLAETQVDAERADRLRHEAAARRTAAEAAMARAAAALQRQDHAAAIDELIVARQTRAANADLDELTVQLVTAATAQVRQDLIRGRCDLAEPLLERLRLLAAANAQVESLARVAALCQRAWQLIRRGRLYRAGEVLRLAVSILPEAAWLAEAIDAAGRAEGAMDSLRTGPLGMLSTPGGASGASEASEASGATGASGASQPGEATEATGMIGTNGAGEASEAREPGEPGEAAQARRPSSPAGRPAASPLLARAPAGQHAALPDRFLLQVDGAGSFVVLRPARVTIGPISSSRMPDLGLLTDPNLPVVTIERVEGDYLLRSASPVIVNDKPATSKLLSDGDRIALSDRCRLRFHLPNAASGSAVLDVSGARLPHGDARRVILLDRELVVGDGPSAHVRTEHMPGQAVLYLRDGCLLCRSEAEVRVNRRTWDGQSPLPMDVPVRVGPVGLVINRI